MAVIGFIILNVLVIFFVPKFEPIFERLKAKGELPALTTFIIGLSHFIIDNWWWMIPLGGVAIFGFLAWKRSESGRMTFDRVKLRVPVAGKLVLSLALGRFTRILGTLLANGIPILRSLEIAKDSTGNRVLAQAIHESAENITAGQKLAAPLRRCKYFPSDVVEMIAVAEESNSLEKVLVDIANALEKRSGPAARIVRQTAGAVHAAVHGRDRAGRGHGAVVAGLQDRLGGRLSELFSRTPHDSIVIGRLQLCTCDGNVGGGREGNARAEAGGQDEGLRLALRAVPKGL